MLATLSVAIGPSVQRRSRQKNRVFTYQIQSSSHKVVSHTRTILRSSTPDKHDTVLLDVVTLTGDIRRHDISAAQLNTRNLALSRVGLLGTNDTDTQTHALLRRALGGGQGWRGCVASALALAAAAEDLI
jgi:uncharacterized phage protein gp47/JayE